MPSSTLRLVAVPPGRLRGSGAAPRAPVTATPGAARAGPPRPTAERRNSAVTLREVSLSIGARYRRRANITENEW